MTNATWNSDRNSAYDALSLKAGQYCYKQVAWVHAKITAHDLLESAQYLIDSGASFEADTQAAIIVEAKRLKGEFEVTGQFKLV
jgi:hypothetical protein